MTTATPTELPTVSRGGTGDPEAVGLGREGHAEIDLVAPRAPGPAAGHGDEGITDQVLGRSLVVGTLAGVPLTWAVATALMLPFGLGIAASAGVFVGIASGPFFGAATVLMATVLRQEQRAREAASWR